ncbi:exodeoxyribonuclease VII large subunit [Chryseobacterium sp. JUb7]|uniref:exodeoxyribonuclease VII large subunit n=1 Tax=Chryseobacterium sp. JUb7 TaxID=2940599 RepID=UPI002168B62D|nr:exodeoxyribonuclease VII large subunit [Chryseobacterium sp. JUb7]MCS3532876.1 exonuclease VII large subunit [Chryseobacterium sp. JUb7]
MEEELERYELIQRKLEIGSKDLETLIRDKMLKDEKVRIANIYGNNAIVQKDFLEGLDVSGQYFEIDDHSCNITSSTAIISKLNEISSMEYDIVALVRGGGDRQSMETFNNIQLSELFIELNKVTITAIGHTVDETLLDKLADKRFHLPHDYGSGLHAIAEKLSHERSNSRALLIDEVKKDVSKQFSEQVKTLTEQLSKRNEEFQKLQESSVKQLQDTQKNFSEQEKQRKEELESYKKEMHTLHERNIQSAVNEKTAAMKVRLETLNQDNVRLNQELQNSKTDYVKIIFALILALVIGFFLAKTL